MAREIEGSLETDTRHYWFRTPVIKGPFDLRGNGDDLRLATIWLHQRIMRGKNGLMRCYFHQTGIGCAIKFIPTLITAEELDRYIYEEVVPWALEVGFFPDHKVEDEFVITRGDTSVSITAFTFSSRLSHEFQGDRYDAQLRHLTQELIRRNRSILAVTWDTYGCTVVSANSVEDDSVPATVQDVVRWGARAFELFPLEQDGVPTALSGPPTTEPVVFRW